MKIITLLRRTLFALSAYVCLPAILILLTIDVVLRYFFNSPLRWTQEAATIVLFLSMVLAFPESWVRGTHIKADFLTTQLGHFAHEILNRFVWFLVLVSSILIIIQCFADINLMILFDERSEELDLPLTWFRAILAFTSAVCAVIAGVRLFSRRAIPDVTGESL